MLSVGLFVPILGGVTGGAAEANSPLNAALVVGWLVMILVVFILGVSVATRVVRDGRHDEVQQELRLSLAPRERLII